MARHSKLTKEQIDKILSLSAQGETSVEIAKELGITPASVWYWINKRNENKAARLTNDQLVCELRNRGFDVTAKKIIEL